MPISRPDAIPIVGKIIWDSNPQSILDIGVGFGMWGVLFRTWTDIRLSELYPSRYAAKGWQTKIDGIEIHEGYKNIIHKTIYNSIWYGDALQLLQVMQPMKLYDHIHLGDVIEHLEKDEGKLLLELCHEHTRVGGMTTVVTPAGYRPQGAVLGNEHETHKCGWTARDFQVIGARHVWTPGGGQIVATFTHDS
jgi:2-polyprenyl-3-methyl-5-hydroxy-6-metoxy-1,4-benzoquinol methylase